MPPKNSKKKKDDDSEASTSDRIRLALQKKQQNVGPSVGTSSKSRKNKNLVDPDHPDIKYGPPDEDSPRASMGPSVEEVEIAKEVDDLMAAYDDLESHVNAAISLMPLFEGRSRYFHGIQDQSIRFWKQYNNVLFSQTDGTVPEPTLTRHFQRYNGRYKLWMENLANDGEK